MRNIRSILPQFSATPGDSNQHPHGAGEGNQIGFSLPLRSFQFSGRANPEWAIIPQCRESGNTKSRPLIKGAWGTVALSCRKRCLSRSLKVNQELARRRRYCGCVLVSGVCTCVCVFRGRGWFQCPRQREMHVRGPKVGNCKY